MQRGNGDPPPSASPDEWWKKKGAYSCTAPGPQPLGCINARTTLVSKTDSAFGDKAASWKANALENIDALSLRTLMQPEGCGPGLCPSYAFKSGQCPNAPE